LVLDVSSKHVLLIVLSCAFAGAACSDSPTAPTATTPVPTNVDLSISQDSVALARNASTRLFVRVRTSDGGGSDVTATATWTTSDAAVATVSGGLVTAVGPGAAKITVSYAGLSRMVDVSVRRNTILVGAGVFVEQPLPADYLRAAVDVYLDDRLLLAGQSSVKAEVTFVFGDRQWYSNTSVAPGPHQLAVRTRTTLSGQRVTVRFDQPVEIRDRDTGETVARLSLPLQSVLLSANVTTTIAWTLDVGAYQ
jgi:hypothetical protein